MKTVSGKMQNFADRILRIDKWGLDYLLELEKAKKLTMGNHLVFKSILNGTLRIISCCNMLYYIILSDCVMF